MIISLAKKYIKSQEILNRIEEKIYKYEKFKELLYYWNKKINLTSFKKEDFYFHVIIENLIIFDRFDTPENILDIGTGFGNPSISLAITFPEIEIYCSEINKKRLSFLYFIKNDFGLNNLKIFEYYYPKKEYDIITARGFMEYKNLLSFLKEKNLKYKKVWLFLKSYPEFEKVKEIVPYRYQNKKYFQVLLTQ